MPLCARAGARKAGPGTDRPRWVTGDRQFSRTTAGLRARSIAICTWVLCLLVGCAGGCNAAHPKPVSRCLCVCVESVKVCGKEPST
uniref:Uncharacterized protein n=1 Tax=Anopheles dirus TaxID=7168 RepID=A0A182NK44_9DIPT